MNLQELINAYNFKYAKDLIVQRKGIYRLKAYDRFTLSLEKSLEEGKFFLYTAIKEVSIEEEKEVFELALEGNLFQAATGGASLGYSSSTHLLVLFQSFEEERVTLEIFEEELNRFCRYLAFWQEKLYTIEKKPLEDPFKGLQEKEKLKIFFA